MVKSKSLYEWLEIFEEAKSMHNEDIEQAYLIGASKNLYGSYKIKVYGFVGYQCGSFENEMEFDYFLHEITTKEKLEFASVSRVIDGEIVTEIIIDNK
jgi:hypothetical protein